MEDAKIEKEESSNRALPESRRVPTAHGAERRAVPHCSSAQPIASPSAAGLRGEQRAAGSAPAPRGARRRVEGCGPGWLGAAPIAHIAAPIPGLRGGALFGQQMVLCGDERFSWPRLN